MNDIKFSLRQSFFFRIKTYIRSYKHTSANMNTQHYHAYIGKNSPFFVLCIKHDSSYWNGPTLKVFFSSVSQTTCLTSRHIRSVGLVQSRQGLPIRSVGLVQNRQTALGLILLASESQFFSGSAQSLVCPCNTRTQTLWWSQSCCAQERHALRVQGQQNSWSTT